MKSLRVGSTLTEKERTVTKRVRGDERDALELVATERTVDTTSVCRGSRAHPIGRDSYVLLIPYWNGKLKISPSSHSVHLGN